MRISGRARTQVFVAVAAVCLVPCAATTQTLAPDEPTVVIQQPANNADVTTLGVVLTDIPLVIAYSAPAGADRLEVLVDGKLQFKEDLGGRRSGTASYLWDVTLHGPGAHKIGAVIYSGTQSASSEVTVNYGGGGAAPPRTGVAFTSPAEGQVITGVATFDVRVEGAIPTWVMFLLDEHQVGTRVGAPLSMAFDTSGYSDGTHALQAIVRTDKGQKLESEILHVVFRNSPVTVPGGAPGEGGEPALPKDALLVVPPIDPNLMQASVPGAAPTGGLVVPPQVPEFMIAEPTAGVASSGPGPGPGGLPPLESEMAEGPGWKPLSHREGPGPTRGPGPSGGNSVRPLEPDLADPGSGAMWRPLGSTPPTTGPPQLPQLQPGIVDEAPVTVQPNATDTDDPRPAQGSGAASTGTSIPEPELAGPEGEQKHAVPVRSAVTGTGGSGPSTSPTIGPGPPAEHDIAIRVGMAQQPLAAPGVVRSGLLLVPLNALTEALSGRCSVDASTGGVVAEFQGTSLTLRPGSDVARSGDRGLRLECPVEDRGGVLYVPFSALRDLWGLSLSLSPGGAAAEVMFIPGPGVE